MSWQASLTWHHAQSRAKIITQIREFFAQRQVVEVETPLLSNHTVTDVHLDAFSSRYNFLADASKAQSSTMYLQTSPEFAMKRLLASGYGCIYQVCKAFRHEPYGRYHNPEFTMLEWYRLGYDHFDLMTEVAELLQTVLACSTPVQMTYQAAFIKYVTLDPLTASREQLFAAIKRSGKFSEWLLSVDDDTLLQFIFAELIECHIGADAPCFIYHFPASQASLAKISREDPSVAERFECYYRGIELANGFHELTDADLQLARFEQDNVIRTSNRTEKKAIDPNFIQALSSGLPECSGVALGIDRLVMLALELDHIDQTLTFSVEQA